LDLYPCQGFSKVEDPGQNLIRMRGETPILANEGTPNIDAKNLNPNRRPFQNGGKEAA